MSKMTEIVLEDVKKYILSVCERESPISRMLDVGCWNGETSKLFQTASKAKEIYGIDIFEKQIQAKQQFQFMPYVAKFTEEMIPYDYDQKIGFAPFPSYFGKIKKKSDDLLLEAQLKKKLEKM